MEKTTLKIIAALLILLAVRQAASYLNGRASFQKYIDLPQQAEYDISIHYYSPQGMNLQVTDQTDRQTIVQALTSLAYAGHTQHAGVNPDDEVYSLQIYPTQQQKGAVIVNLSEKAPSYIIDNNVGLKISNPEELQQLVSKIYAKISQSQ